MKTKEIDVWVGSFESEHDLTTFKYEEMLDEEGNLDVDYIKKNNLLKGRLVVEIPEKKIEITESQFDKLAKSCMTINCYGLKKVYYDDLKKELFGDD